MRFVSVVVLLALAFGIETSTIALVPPITYTAVSGPAMLAAPSAWDHSAWAPATSWSIQNSWAAPSAIATPHAAIAPIWSHEGSYIAKTRGAVHVAFLAGHANSAASINLQPAPGTI